MCKTDTKYTESKKGSFPNSLILIACTKETFKACVVCSVLLCDWKHGSPKIDWSVVSPQKMRSNALLLLPGKVHIFREGHKILRNLHLGFVLCSCENFVNFSGLLRKHELYTLHITEGCKELSYATACLCKDAACEWGLLFIFFNATASFLIRSRA